MIVLFLIVGALAGSGQDMETVDRNPPPEYNYLNLDPDSFVDDPNPPEPDPEFTIRPNVPYTRRGNGNGTATVRFTGPVVIIVRPSLLARSIGISGARRATLPAGSEITGPDSNRNNIPDDLEAQEVDVSNGAADRMTLHVLDDGGVALAVYLEAEHGVAASRAAEGEAQISALHHHADGNHALAVDDTGDVALGAQAASSG